MIIAEDNSIYKIRPVLLAGGLGNRVSHLNGNTSLPKQFHKLDNGKGLSLLEATLARLPKNNMFEHPFIFTNGYYKSYLPEADAQIYYEPIRKNTFMPVLAAAILAQKAGNDLILVLPCDHIINAQSALSKNIFEGAAQAYMSKKLVYFGITPDYPETQFGYISQCGDGEIAFHEKPSCAKATDLIEKGALWNSGIFLISVQSFLNDIQHIAPDLYAITMQYNLDKPDLPSEIWSAAPDISFDRFYCERIKEGIIIKAEFDWCDIGAPERYIISEVAAV